jgi:hypothetical protein
MEKFYLITLTVAIIFLILILTYIGIKLRKSNVAAKFPPQMSNCPDNWIFSNNKCQVPNSSNANYGKSNLINNGVKTPGYSSSTNTIDFTDKGWYSGGKSAVCNKKYWANSIGITWDGVTNYNKC